MYVAPADREPGESIAEASDRIESEQQASDSSGVQQPGETAQEFFARRADERAAEKQASKELLKEYQGSGYTSRSDFIKAKQLEYEREVETKIQTTRQDTPIQKPTKVLTGEEYIVGLAKGTVSQGQLTNIQSKTSGTINKNTLKISTITPTYTGVTHQEYGTVTTSPFISPSAKTIEQQRFDVAVPYYLSKVGITPERAGRAGEFVGEVMGSITSPISKSIGKVTDPIIQFVGKAERSITAGGLPYSETETISPFFEKYKTVSEQTVVTKEKVYADVPFAKEFNTISGYETKVKVVKDDFSKSIREESKIITGKVFETAVRKPSIAAKGAVIGAAFVAGGSFLTPLLPTTGILGTTVSVGGKVITYGLAAGYTGVKSYEVMSAETKEEKRQIIAESTLEVGGLIAGGYGATKTISFLKTPKITDIYGVETGKPLQAERNIIDDITTTRTSYTAGEVNIVRAETPLGKESYFAVQTKGLTSSLDIGGKLPTGSAVREVEILSFKPDSTLKSGMTVGGRYDIGVPLKYERVVTGTGGVRQANVVGFESPTGGRVVSEYSFKLDYGKGLKTYGGTQSSEFQYGGDSLKVISKTTPKVGKQTKSETIFRLKQTEVPLTTMKYGKDIGGKDFIKVTEGTTTGYEYIGGKKGQPFVGKVTRDFGILKAEVNVPSGTKGTTTTPKTQQYTTEKLKFLTRTQETGSTFNYETSALKQLETTLSTKTTKGVISEMVTPLLSKPTITTKTTLIPLSLTKQKQQVTYDTKYEYKTKQKQELGILSMEKEKVGFKTQQSQISQLKSRQATRQQQASMMDLKLDETLKYDTKLITNLTTPTTPVTYVPPETPFVPPPGIPFFGFGEGGKLPSFKKPTGMKLKGMYVSSLVAQEFGMVGTKQEVKEAGRLAIGFRPLKSKRQVIQPFI